MERAAKLSRIAILPVRRLVCALCERVARQAKRVFWMLVEFGQESWNDMDARRRREQEIAQLIGLGARGLFV